ATGLGAPVGDRRRIPPAPCGAQRLRAQAARARRQAALDRRGTARGETLEEAEAAPEGPHGDHFPQFPRGDHALKGPIAREGYPFILPPAAVAALAFSTGHRIVGSFFL